MSRPVIGVMPQYDAAKDQVAISANYFRALRDAGALPVLLPLQSGTEDVKELLERVDGVLYPGGPDVSPLRFGEG